MLLEIMFSNTFEITLIAFEVDVFMEKFYMFHYIALLIGTEITLITWERSWRVNWLWK